MVLPCSEPVPAERKIKEGDLVVVYENYTSIKAVYVDIKDKVQNRYGTFMHKVGLIAAGLLLLLLLLLCSIEGDHAPHLQIPSGRATGITSRRDYHRLPDMPEVAIIIQV